MKVAIVVYSQSGTTAKIAKALSAVFTAKGHDVDTTLLRTSGNVSSRSGAFELRSVPDIKGYDCVIIGGPVMSFGASRVIMKFLSQVGRLDGTKVLCLVTKGLPFVWTGGKQAIAAMENELSLSRAELLPGEILFAQSIKSEEQLTALAAKLAAACGA